ncbi:hypothetical protein P885DRAFT_73181 [Corynascus similis CBS 632.67]
MGPALKTCPGNETHPREAFCCDEGDTDCCDTPAKLFDLPQDDSVFASWDQSKLQFVRVTSTSTVSSTTAVSTTTSTTDDASTTGSSTTTTSAASPDSGSSLTETSAETPAETPAETGVSSDSNREESSSSSSSSSGLSVGAQAGIGVGVAVCALLLGIIAFLLWKLYQSKKAATSAATAADGDGDTVNQYHQYGQVTYPKGPVVARPPPSELYTEPASELDTDWKPAEMPGVTTTRRW